MAREISLGGVWQAQQVARVPDGGEAASATARTAAERPRS